MCGRLAVSKDFIDEWILEHLDTPFSTNTQLDLCPSQAVDTLTLLDGSLHQQRAHWGIQPSWSKQLIINAKSETVASKITFQKAFTTQRCLVPCSGWYEWKNEGGPKKQKYLFSPTNEAPFFMAGIWFQQNDTSQLVTLTTRPNERSARIHHRMPVLILPKDIPYWFNSNNEEVTPLFEPIDSQLIEISHC